MIDDDEDMEIEFSSLGGKITRDGITVEVFIYRGDDGNSWILEVQDHEGGSTLWDDAFSTDVAALVEFNQTLDKKGIRSFLEDEPQMLN